MKSGTVSIRFAPRSRSATVRGWLQMITPAVRVPDQVKTENSWLLRVPLSGRIPHLDKIRWR
jgi:hypothetical protein